jgi:tetratricopeptide (TPR) repeat protein
MTSRFRRVHGLVAAASIVASLAAAPLDAALAVTGTTTVSFRNSRPFLPDNVYRAQLAAAKSLACMPPLPPGFTPPPGLPPPRVAPHRLTFAAAMAGATKVAGLKGARATKLRRLKLAHTAVGGERLAAGALLEGAGKGALAALLTAAARSPRDPLPLIDAAALLLDAGKPNESLALLTRAQRLPQRRLLTQGLPTIAVLETNRAAALFRTGQYAAAAAAGQRALRRSNGLVEARENRGMALLCMNRDEEAVCEFRAAARRPLEPGEERLSCVGARPATPADFGFDTAPEPGVYPPIGYPALASKAEGYVDYYVRLDAESNARFAAANDKYNELAIKGNQPDGSRQPASKRRADDLVLEMQKVPLRPSFVAQFEQGEAIARSIGDLAAETLVEMHRIQIECPDVQCVYQRCNPLVTGNHTVFLARQTQLEGVMRQWWHDLSPAMEGYARSIGDDDTHGLAITQVDLQGIAGWDVIRGGAKAWNGVPASLKPLCLGGPPEPPVSDPTVGPNGAPLVPCPPNLDRLKAKFDIGEGVVRGGPLDGARLGAGIEVKCSEVKVSVDGSWSPAALLTGFGRLSYATNPYGGTLTIGFGSKAGIGPVNFSSGLELTISGQATNTVVDLTWKVGPAAGPKSDIVDIPIMKSTLPPIISPTFPVG